jgi:rare lipoprotein A
MRGCLFGLLLLLCSVVAESASAQPASGGAVVIARSPGHGFDWFFAQKKPEMSCEGDHVVATWYSIGNQTASGAPFNPDGITAAHRTLPFGSRVTITNPRNGKSVTVVINDRGPFTKGVHIDLARGAARAIDMRDTQWVCMTVER